MSHCWQDIYVTKKYVQTTFDHFKSPQVQLPANCSVHFPLLFQNLTFDIVTFKQ